MKRLLLIEDDPVIHKTLSFSLRSEGFEVMGSQSLADARRHLTPPQSPFDLCLLDVTLPDGSGIDFIAELKARYPELPVFLITARTEEATAVKGLTSGASDYIRKPFGVAELVVRMKKLWKAEATRELGGLSVDIAGRSVRYRGKQLELARRELELLACLMRHSERVVSRERLLQLIDPDGETFDRSIDKSLSRLRKTLKDAGVDTVRIVSVYGEGYRLERA